MGYWEPYQATKYADGSRHLDGSQGEHEPQCDTSAKKADGNIGCINRSILSRLE